MPALPSWEESDGSQLESILSEICFEILVSAEVLLRRATQERYRDLAAQRQRSLEKARVTAEQ